MPRRLIHDLDICFPFLPAALDGLRIAQLTDLHIARPRRRHRQVVSELAESDLDLIFLTGDYMSHRGEEPASAQAMREIVAGLRARLGIFAVFGNHDSQKLRRVLTDLPLRWLHNDCVRPGGLPLDVLGIDTDYDQRPDSVALLSGWAKVRNNHQVATTRGQAEQERPLHVLLSHLPMFLPSAGDLSIDLMFAGHTHGGQCRLPRGRALVNSSDFPLRLTSGILRHQQTICIVSRGLGEVNLPLRVLCPPHLPVITLRRGPLLGKATHHVENVRPW